MLTRADRARRPQPVTTSDLRALTGRADLLAQEAAGVARNAITWAARLAELGDYGTSGGSAADRRRIVQVMAAIEAGQVTP